MRAFKDHLLESISDLKMFRDLEDWEDEESLVDGKYKYSFAASGRNQQRKVKGFGAIETLLKKYGFSIAGMGTFAKVYTHPSYSYAVKVYMTDTGYEKWLHFCRANQDNPYVPKVRGQVFTTKNKRFHIVRVEKLEKISDNQFRIFADNYIKWNNGDINAVDVELDRALKFIKKIKSLPDFHQGNLMQRPSNGQIVIIDI